ncbi:MAG: fliQ [Actinomycetia bacterium]|nr:fliQ [Actinomycetes bacterium]
MSDTSVLEIAIQAMLLTAKLTGPFLAVSLVIGFAVSLFQSVTQVQEVTLTFVPKLAGMGLVLLVAGHWMLSELISYTNQLFDTIPRLLQSA